MRDKIHSSKNLEINKDTWKYERIFGHYGHGLNLMSLAL